MGILRFIGGKVSKDKKSPYVQEVLNSPEKYPEFQDNPQILATRHVLGVLEIQDIIWNKLIEKYPEKITYESNKSSMNKHNKTVTFEGNFNIKKIEELKIEIIVNGKKENYQVTLIKKPHLKWCKKLSG